MGILIVNKASLTSSAIGTWTLKVLVKITDRLQQVCPSSSLLCDLWMFPKRTSAALGRWMFKNVQCAARGLIFDQEGQTNRTKKKKNSIQSWEWKGGIMKTNSTWCKSAGTGWISVRYARHNVPLFRKLCGRMKKRRKKKKMYVKVLFIMDNNKPSSIATSLGNVKTCYKTCLNLLFKTGCRKINKVWVLYCIQTCSNKFCLMW